MEELLRIKELIDCAITMRRLATDPNQTTAIRYKALIIEEGVLDAIILNLKVIDDQKSGSIQKKEKS